MTVPVQEIVGPAEIREMAGGVSRATFSRWRRQWWFPKPIRTLEAVELWDAREVAIWLERAEFFRRHPR